jgi:ParB/Sulfiredoxin domain
MTTVPQPSSLRKVPLSAITLDRQTQSRVAMHQHKVEEYAEELRAGRSLFDSRHDPVQLYHDGTAYWIADGWHRIQAAILAHWASIPALVLTGSKEDAILAAAAANLTHGIQRTNRDKRRAVLMLLNHPRARTWGGRKIATHAGVTHPFVANVRKEHLSGNGYQITGDREVERGGTTYTMRKAQRPARTDSAPHTRALAKLAQALDEIYDENLVMDAVQVLQRRPELSSEDEPALRTIHRMAADLTTLGSLTDAPSIADDEDGEQQP